jgi:hypothetical protein
VTDLEIRRGLDVLRNYYAKDNQPHRLNDAQWAVYLDGLRAVSAAELETAARAWMQRSRWFPALSDLLGLLRPQVDASAAAHLAWTTLERALRSAGAYRGATFLDGAIGETARQVFGSWPAACAFDLDSPGWAIRRQSFLAIYPTLASRVTGPVTLRGMDAQQSPQVIGHVPGLALPPAAADDARELTQAEAVNALGEVTRRFLAQARQEAS